MAPKVSEIFSWRIAKAKDLLSETDIERLACVALLCLDNMNYDKAIAAYEFGAASANSFRVTFDKLKKKLREGGAILSLDGELQKSFNESAAESVSEPMTPNKGGRRKRKTDNNENGEDKVKRSKGTPKGKVKVEQEVDKAFGVEEQTEV